MSQIIQLNTKDIVKIIEEVLIKKPKHFDNKTNLLEFAKRLYIWDYKQNGKHLNEVDQKKFFDNLVIKKRSIIKEYDSKFNNSLILESEKGLDYITQFFDFLKENSIPMVDEQTKSVAPKPTTPSNVGTIMKNLHQAFDGLGTDEALAVKTILSIKTKDDLVKIDQQIKNTVGKKYPKIQTLAAWINDEMSEVDPKEYDKIWGHLAKMGYKGKESNKFLRAVGSTKEMIQKGWDWAKQGIIGKFFNGLRDALNSGWGIASQLLLDALGPFTLGISAGLVVVVWALLFLWDMLNLVSGSPEWLNLVFDALGLFTAGAMSKVLSKFRPAAGSTVFKSIGDFFKWMGSTKLGAAVSKWVPTIQGALSSVSGAITTAAKWISTKLSKLFGPKIASSMASLASKAKAWLTDFAKKIGQWFGTKSKQVVASAVAKKVEGGLGEKIVEKLGSFLGTPTFLQTEIGTKLIEKGFKPATQQVVDKYVIDLSKEKGIDFAAEAVDKKFGKLYGDIIRLGALGEDTLGNKDKFLASIGEFDQKDVAKFLKTSKEIGKTGKKVTTSAGEANLQKNVVVGDTKNIRAGGPKDPNQYKFTNNQYFYASKNEKVPNWKPVKGQQATNYLNKYVFKDLIA